MRLKGYVQDVCPTVKKSRAKSFPYFNFSLQVVTAMKGRAVCYDTSKHYEESCERNALQNITEKRNLTAEASQTTLLSKKVKV